MGIVFLPRALCIENLISRPFVDTQKFFYIKIVFNQSPIEIAQSD